MGEKLKNWDDSELRLPKGMTLADRGTYLEITRPWSKTVGCFLILFSAFWWFALSEFLPELWFNSSGNAGWERFIPVLHVIAGIGVGYSAIAFLLNTSYIYTDKSRMEIRHRPIPWRGNKVLEASQLGQLYVKETIHRNKNSTSKSYDVRAKTYSGGDIKILSGLQNSQQAIFIEQQLEKYLDIENMRVRGEY